MMFYSINLLYIFVKRLINSIMSFHLLLLFRFEQEKL